jgi:hypothetical protein
MWIATASLGNKRESKMKARTSNLLLSGALMLTLAGAAGAAESFRGHVVDMSGGRRASSAHFTLHIEEFADSEEIRGLVSVLAEGGQDDLEKALRDLDRGWIRVGASLGYPISVARSIETEDGRMIRVVTDRPIQMFEVMRGLRSVDYPFGLIEITLGKDGKGEGRLIAAAQVEFSKEGAVEVTSLGTQPFRLMKVRPEKP